MRLVSEFLKYGVYPILHHSGLLKQCIPTGGCVVVNYHGVFPDGYVSRDSFLDGNLVTKNALREQLRLLKSRYHVISPNDFHQWLEGNTELPLNAVLITCDDGLLNTLTDMLPVLENEHVSCLFFVLGASCDQKTSRLWYEELYELFAFETRNFGRDIDLTEFRRVWWKRVQDLSALDTDHRTRWLTTSRTGSTMTADSSTLRRSQLLNVDQLKQLAAAGMEIGAHTVSHPVLSACSDEIAHLEIEQSKREIESALGKPVWAFAYPFGNPTAMGDREVRLAREAGFKCAFVNTGGAVADRSRRFTLPRAHVTAGMNLSEFEAHVTGFHHRLQRAVRG